jgi:F-type H+-transporting ATPase subunit b
MKRVCTVLITLATMLFLAGGLRAAEEAAHAEAHSPAGTPASPAAPETAHEGTTPHGGHGEHGGSEETPGLIATPNQGLITAVTTLIVFCALLAILGKFAWGPIASGLQAREDKIRKDIADAEAARKRAEETLGQYNQQLATAERQVRDILAKAGADAEKIATSMKMQAQQEAEEIKERATRDIENARKQALNDIYAQAAELSTNIASKILRRNLNADDQRDLVNSSLEQLQTVGGKV